MTETFQPRDPHRFEAALRRFDEENSARPASSSKWRVSRTPANCFTRNG